MALRQFVLFSIFYVTMGEYGEKSHIPNHLLDCYSEPPPRLLPRTVNTLVEILRKINFDSYTPVSVAQQAADLLYWFSVDGLERDPNIVVTQVNVVPYHQTGFQAYKQDLLFKKLLTLQRRSFDGYSLSLPEKCTLHFMMSTSVDPWARGDESTVCPNTYETFRRWVSPQDTAPFSSCPIEGGAVLTSGGTVNVESVVAGLATALAPQQVALVQLMTPEQLQAVHLYPAPTDTISNFWAATIAGNLAEVAVVQAPQYDMDVNIGIHERWNDSYIPMKLYFSNVPYNIIEKRGWQITDAEILGGIDGMLLGRLVSRRRLEVAETRLSQLLDMYYLETRLGDHLHVCRRASTFNNFIRDDRDKFINQTQNMAALMTTETTSYFTNSRVLSARCVKIVEKFMRYYPDLLGVEDCPTQDLFKLKLNLIMIFDATWPPYTMLQFLVSFSQAADIGYYGGTIAVINGDSTDVRVDTTSSPITLYGQMVSSSEDGEDPNGLILQNSLIALQNMIEASNVKENNLQYPRRAKQDLVIVMGFSATISDQDLEESKDLLEILKSENPALRFVYWMSEVNAERFEPLMRAAPNSHRDSIVTTTDSSLDLVLPRLQSVLHSARTLKPAYCKNDTHQWPESTYDEYISPGTFNSYWIHPDYLCGSLDIVKVTFKNYEYGELHICMSRDEEERGDCKRVDEDQDVTHAVLRPCETQEWDPTEDNPDWRWHPACRPLYFTVSVIGTRHKCTEYECRFLDQVKFSIVVQDLHCINLNYAVCAGHSLYSYFICIVTAILFIYAFSNG